MQRELIGAILAAVSPAFYPLHGERLVQVKGALATWAEEWSCDTF
jgi:hypothetical protein